MRLTSLATRRNVFIAAMALAVVASWLLLDRERDTAARPSADERRPDSYFNGMTLTRFDTDGRPAIHVSAGRALHYPNDPLVHLEAVRASSQEPHADWQLTAHRGELATERNHLRVEQDVRLAQLRPGKPPLTMSTSLLELDGDREIASTPEPVEIRYGDSRISGHGLWASLAEGHFIIEARVRARYEPLESEN